MNFVQKRLCSFCLIFRCFGRRGGEGERGGEGGGAGGGGGGGLGLVLAVPPTTLRNPLTHLRQVGAVDAVEHARRAELGADRGGAERARELDVGRADHLSEGLDDRAALGH